MLQLAIVDELASHQDNVLCVAHTTENNSGLHVDPLGVTLRAFVWLCFRRNCMVGLNGEK